MNRKRPWTHESGASLVSVMVAMALFAVVAVMASQSFRNINVSNRRADATMSAKDVESIAVQAIVSNFKNYARGRCSDLAAVKTPTPIGSLADLTVTSKFEFMNKDHNAFMATPEIAKDDVNRCNQTSFTKAPLPNVDSFYTCYTIAIKDEARKKATGQDAFASTRGAFIEVYVRLRNLQTDGLVTCDQIVQDRGFGLELIYSMHWATGAGSRTATDVTDVKDLTDFFYDSKTGSLSAAL